MQDALVHLLALAALLFLGFRWSRKLYRHTAGGPCAGCSSDCGACSIAALRDSAQGHTPPADGRAQAAPAPAGDTATQLRSK